ncbi:MAG: pyruvate kinase [Firmicutes bacterium]|nr:pyruvate kinase [Bacillota bacterium]
MRRTKIVCTIGPASENPEVIAALIEAGMDVARLNLSHGMGEDHWRRLSTVKEISRQMNKIVAILVDTRGPEVRTGPLRGKEICLVGGDKFILTTAPGACEEKKVSVTYPRLPQDLVPGRLILIDDGMITLRVEEICGEEIVCRVVEGGILKSNKGLNLPGSVIRLPALGEADRADLKIALEKGAHFVAASFARNCDDIIELRRFLEEEHSEAKVIAKIENDSGLDNFEQILNVADGVMVARGDLGVEIPAEEVPLLQKKIIRLCNRAGKPVITATQMLESMIHNPRPTRAEASDVANAIFDGTDAVMLSGETAVGAFPVEAVKTMSRISHRTEEALNFEGILLESGLAVEKNVTDAISYATCNVAGELGASAIITPTESGHTARMVSKYRPKAPVIAVTPRYDVAAGLQVTWGVTPLLCPPSETTDEVFIRAMGASKDAGLIRDGDLVVITAGVPVGVPGTTNFLRVETVGEIMVMGTGIGKKAVFGKAVVISDLSELPEVEEGQIIVTRSVDSEFLPALKKAAAVVTEEEGLTSHGAILALHLGKPAIVGAKNATLLISSGDAITVDSTRGLVYRGKASVL